MKLILSIATFGALLTGSALAGDLIIPATPAPAVASPADDWSGFYLGVNGGYGAGTINFETDTATPELDGITRSFSATGWLLGATAGYNAQMDGFVLGVEGDVDWAKITGAADPINAGGADTIVTGNIDWLGTLRGRVGFAAGPLLLYGTGGLAVGGVSGNITNFPHDGMSVDSSGTQVGWTVGAGVEAALNDTISVKAEYLYVDLGTHGYDLGLDASDVNDMTANVHPTANIVRGGINFKF